MLNAAVLGSPIAHSLSPVLHRAGYAACGLSGWQYGAHEVAADELVAFLSRLDESWRGLSLTMPLKEVAFQVATQVSGTARAARSINTLVRRADGGWNAHNTDVIGIERALGAGVRAPSATVLGAGATARSAVVALCRLGLEHLRVAARRPEQAAELAAFAQGLPARAPDVDVVPLQEWATAPVSVVVSSLPPAASRAVAAQIRPGGGVLLDVVYANWPTPLARAAQDHGFRVVSGLDMLVHQGAAQFEMFTGVRPAPVDAMFAAGHAALAQATS